MTADALLDWYEEVRRPLPWRFTRDPWAILVSEVMLQQTQAARVVPHYERFLARYPAPEALAAAPAAEAIAAWSGLGYNRRVLALRAAARVVAEAGWPPPDALETLPGVGPYTAAALGSFGWDAPMAAVDTNVRRVIERRDGVRRGPKALARRAAELLPEGRAAAWNQAMMELGATVCRPRRPACGACPLRRGCAGPEAITTPAHRRRPAQAPFEATDRWARGRVLAALVEREALPALAPERRERALAGLERDGLVVRGPDGEPRLP
jgi:A/G-specific adenine glycosylase